MFRLWSIGEGKEFEYLPGVSLTVASLPNVTLKPFHFTQDILPNPDESPDAWKETVDVLDDDPKTIILFPDSFSIRTAVSYRHLTLPTICSV